MNKCPICKKVFQDTYWKYTSDGFICMSCYKAHQQIIQTSIGNVFVQPNNMNSLVVLVNLQELKFTDEPAMLEMRYLRIGNNPNFTFQSRSLPNVNMLSAADQTNIEKAIARNLSVWIQFNHKLFLEAEIASLEQLIVRRQKEIEDYHERIQSIYKEIGELKANLATCYQANMASSK